MYVHTYDAHTDERTDIEACFWSQPNDKGPRNLALGSIAATHYSVEI